MRRLLKKWAALALALLLLLPAAGLADEPVRWLYSFAAGDVLSGKKAEGVRELLDALQLSLTSQKREGSSAGQAELLSWEKPVFTLQGELSAEGEMGLYCSLTGNNTLMCRQDQLPDFLATIVRMLGERSILKESSMEQANHLASLAGEYLVKMIDRSDERDLKVGLDPDFYLSQISRVTPETERLELDAQNTECPGAVVKRVWQLNETQLNELVDSGIQKINRIPILSDAIANGDIRIANQKITEEFLRDLFASMHGETVLEAFQDAEGQVLLLRLRTPEITNLQVDPLFSQIRGLEMIVTRNEAAAPGTHDTRTELQLIGLGTLLSVRMEKGPGNEIPPLPSKKVIQVGEMDTQELWKLIRGLSMTIASNAINMVMDMPRIVFDTLVGRLF